MIRVTLPHHLRTLTATSGELRLEVTSPVTLRALMDALEAAYPVLWGTVRNPATGQRRPFVRFFACEADLSNQSLEDPLPDAVAQGDEPLHIVGAIAGG